jgi:hypothetical protein
MGRGGDYCLRNQRLLRFASSLQRVGNLTLTTQGVRVAYFRWLGHWLLTALLALLVSLDSLLSMSDSVPGTVIHSWLANSFANKKGHQFVPVTAVAIAVTPDGTVFSAGVAEAYGGVASYKAGKFVTKYDYESGFGSSAFAVAVDDSYVYIGTGVGVFRTRIGDESYNRTPIIKGSVYGLSLRSGELYVSDTAANKIRIFSTATMKEIRSFPAPRPGPLAVSADGRVWVIQGKPGEEPFAMGGQKIISFSKDGKPGPEITDFENPCALAFDLKGRLLVAGLNRHCQIWIYDVTVTPKRVGSLGIEGGIFSGEEPGRFEPWKFHWIRGLGFDAAGNLYVASTFGSWYGALIEAYSPEGKRLWYVYGLGNWLDTACSDPANENVVYTKEHVYRMDWSKPPGQEQSLYGLTVDRFRYPLDPRVTDLHGPSHRLIHGVRRIGGRLFLYCGAQGTFNLEIYKFVKGCVAAPCGYVAGASTWRPGSGKRWPEDAETFIWTDENGNGAPEPEEFASVERKPRWGHMHVDATGGIWQCSSSDERIYYLPCEGLDEKGNPIYRRSSEVSYPYPPEFTGDRLRRLFYIPSDDVMIAGGGGPEGAWNVIVRYDHWSETARRKKRWTIKLPLNDKSYTPDINYGGGAPIAMQACGEYLFVAYGYGLVRVHRLDDGGYVGTICPNINGFRGGGGWVDADNALNVTLRKNGEYVIFLENAALNLVMMFRWRPPKR